MNRVALVCAASKGLGRASAEALARDGMRVAMCSRGGPALREAEAAIRAAGGEVIAGGRQDRSCHYRHSGGRCTA